MIKLHFEKLSCFERKQEPCNAAIPFAKGTLNNISELCVTDGTNFVDTQSIATAYWDDGSVKWALVYFFADLPANKSKDYFCDINFNKKTDDIIDISESNSLLKIDTGKLIIKLNNNGFVFNSIESEYISYSENEIIGPRINNLFNACICEPWNIVYNGSVMAVVEGKGKHYDNDGNSIIDFIINIQVFKDKDWFKLDYKVINKEKQESIVLNSINLDFCKTDSENVKMAIGKSNYKTDFIVGENQDSVYQNIDAEGLIYEANEHMAEVFYGTFFADWKNEKGGVSATIYQAQQNFPKALYADKNNLSIQIIPEKSEGIVFCQGMAKTHSVFLHFHSADLSKEEINIRSLQFQLPDKPALEKSVFRDSGVFPDIFLDSDKTIDAVEQAMISKMDKRGKVYGIIHWGDSPDMGYTEQGRGNGDIVWSNNEYDFPHAAMLMYARTSERRFMDYVLVSGKHWMDIDICHFSDNEYRHQGHVIHSANHITGKIDISHEWVEGLFDYYHLTGDKFAYDCAINIGRNIKRNLTLPRYHQNGEINARETGWALRALVALFIETNDKAWLDDAEFILGHFEQWKERYGEWLAPYTDHVAIRVPFMIAIAVGSLMRYYNINPLEKIKKMIIDAVDDVLENCMLDNGLFYYKEMPSLRRLGNNTIILEALTYAYIFTGDKKYLEAGKGTFINCINETQTNIGFSKEKCKDALVLKGPSSKGIAQCFFPMTYFYVNAVKANIKLF